MKIKHSLLAAAIVGLWVSPVCAQLFEVSSSGEFQSALTAAGSNGQDDTIVLSAGTYVSANPGQPFTYSSAQGDDLRIGAETPGQVVLDGQSLAEILSLRNGASGRPVRFSIRGIVFENGNVAAEGARGGGITVVNAGLQLDDAVFVGNVSSKPNSGSAIYLDDSDGQAQLQISNSRFADNVVDIASAGSNGSAIFLSGASFSVADSEFVGNISDACGVIFSDSDVASSVTDSVFRSNRAVRGAALCTRSTRLTVTRSEFSNNEASGEGGVIQGAEGLIRLERSVLSNNRADSAGAIAGAAIELTNSVVSGNSAGRLAIVSASRSFRAENSLFENNRVPNGRESGIIRCEQACSVLNGVFGRNIGAPSIKLHKGTADKLVIANSVFLSNNSSSFAFADTTARATVLNNFIASSLPTLPDDQIDQKDNILDQTDPTLDSDYYPLQGAALIDAGTSEAQLVRLPERDYLGNPRVAGANVDIGWVEFGSSPTAPVVADLALETVDASNLDSLSFSFSVELAEGRGLAVIELWTDEEPDYRVIDSDGGVFGGVVFVNGGAHQIKLRVTDSEGERSEARHTFALNSLSTAGVALKVEEQIRAACAEDMAYCGIDVEAFVAKAIEEAKWACKKDPASCQIETGSFDPGVIATMTPGDWYLYGTGRDITDLTTVFADARIVWFHNGRTWEAFSVRADVVSLLSANGIPTISKIPAGRGFWVKK